LYRAYTAQGDNSLLEDCFNTKFEQSAANLVRKMIEKNVFTDEKSTFFSELGYNPLITRRYMTEVSKRVGGLTV
jgi:hypothetical protein